MSRVWMGLTLLTVLSACHAQTVEDAGGLAWEADGKLPVGLLERLDAGEQITVLVTVRQDDLQPSWHGRSRVAQRHLKQRLFTERTQTVIDGLPTGFSEKNRYDNLPVMALTLSSSQVARALAIDGNVERVFLEQAHTHFLEDSLPLIGQPEAMAAGHGGEGVTVAVLDTGADYSRAAFGSCAGPGGSCGIVVAKDFAPEDGARDKGNFHGTNVSAIVLGVAPEAKVAALDVFRDNGYAYDSEIIAAIDWVIANADTYDIRAMNLSLGGGAYSTTCDDVSPYTQAIEAARAQGILAAIASGNDAQKQKTASPACVSAAVTVGATYTQNYGSIGWSSCTDSTTAADRVTCFSNSADHLDILAPGALIVAGDLTMGGTSQATPHVAGALAVLAAAAPEASADEIESWLLAGPTQTDHRQGRVSPTLDLPASLLAGGIGEHTDTGDTGLLGVNAFWIGGDDGYANNRKVDVWFDTDVGYTEVCLSNEPSCEAWATLPRVGKPKRWNLSRDDGDKTVYAWFRGEFAADGPYSYDLTLDTVLPTDGSVTARGSSETVQVSWFGFSDVGTGITEYVLIGSDRGREPARGCGKGDEYYRGTDTTVQLTGLVDGTTYGLRLCAFDIAGNASEGIALTARPAPEYAPPIGSILINGGDADTNDVRTLVTLSATDPSGVASYCVSTKGPELCTRFKEMREEIKVKLKKGSEERSVWVWFQDSYGNISESPVTDTIFVDTEGPVDGTLLAMPQGSDIRLSWSGFTDDSDVVEYMLAVTDGTKSPRKGCIKDTLLYTGAATSAVHSGLQSGVTYRYRVCPVDGLGNIGDGAIFDMMAP